MGEIFGTSLLEKAVDQKLEEQAEFVRRWKETVCRPGGDKRSVDHSPGSAGMISMSDAEDLTGITSQQVSKWAKRLKDEAKYRATLFGAAYKKAMGQLDDTSSLILSSVSISQILRYRLIKSDVNVGFGAQRSAIEAEAMASYARQAKDETLRRHADRIQARAIRRCGELLKQVGNEEGGRPKENHDGTVMVSRSRAASDAGLSERQKVTALRVASIPEQEFHDAVEAEVPPTVTQLAERGKQTRLVDLGAAAADISRRP